VDLIVLPELFTSGYFFQSVEHLAQAAEPIPGGPSTRALKSWATSLDAAIVAGLAEQAGERFYNSAVLVRPNGTVDTYRKVHLFYQEKTLFEPGDLSFPLRARENHVFTITANRYGEERKEDETLTFIGTSEICHWDERNLSLGRAKSVGSTPTTTFLTIVGPTRTDQKVADCAAEETAQRSATTS